MEVAQVSCDDRKPMTGNSPYTCSELMVSAGPASHGTGSALMKGISEGAG